jgi:hypothetical protein
MVLMPWFFVWFFSCLCGLVFLGYFFVLTLGFVWTGFTAWVQWPFVAN